MQGVEVETANDELEASIEEGSFGGRKCEGKRMSVGRLLLMEGSKFEYSIFLGSLLRFSFHWGKLSLRSGRLTEREWEGSLRYERVEECFSAHDVGSLQRMGDLRERASEGDARALMLSGRRRRSIICRRTLLGWGCLKSLRGWKAGVWRWRWIHIRGGLSLASLSSLVHVALDFAVRFDINGSHDLATMIV